MRGEGVRLLLQEDVQVIVVLRGDLWEKKGIWGGKGGGRKERRREGGSSKKGRRRGGERRRRGGGCDASRRAERRSEGERAPEPVDARVVPGQPWESQNQLEVTQPGHLKGKVLGMGAMNTDAGRDVCRAVLHRVWTHV